MPTRGETSTRLLSAIRAVAPGVTGISVGVSGVSASVIVEPADLQTAAQPAIDSFDWSDSVHEQWDRQREPLLRDLIDQSDAAIASIDAYLTGADTATAAQVRAEVKAINQRQRRLVRAVRRLTIKLWRD